jgi:hypothetical protein
MERAGEDILYKKSLLIGLLAAACAGLVYSYVCVGVGIINYYSSETIILANQMQFAYLYTTWFHSWDYYVDSAQNHW